MRNHFFISIRQVIDGDNLREHPWEEMGKMEAFLGLPPHFAEEAKFYFDEEKGFFCLTEIGPMNKGKGRPHPKVQCYLI